MRHAFRLRGRTRDFDGLDTVVAILPTPDARRAAGTPHRLARNLHTALAEDDSRQNRATPRLPVAGRRAFERAGWLFVDARGEWRTRGQRAPDPTQVSALREVFVDQHGGIQVATDLVTVQFPADMSAAQVSQALSARELELVRPLNFALHLCEARITSRAPLMESVARLQQDPLPLFVEPSFLQTLSPRRRFVDVGLAHQWQHSNDGSQGGTRCADIRSEQAWQITRGAGTRIAVIDNGMQLDHPDLVDGIGRAVGFPATAAGGAKFQLYAKHATNFPKGEHGTFCLGMAGARPRHRRGVLGSAPETELWPIACLTDQVGTQTTLARAVAYAANPATEDPCASPHEGADVISCSLGPNGADWDLTSVLELAIESAVLSGRGGRGTPVCWAVSNGPYPVARDEVSSHPLVIGVGRSNRHDRADGSAYGEGLDFLAPGVDVYSTRSGGRYGYASGTSYACPLAAGVAALVLARYPDWTAAQVRDRLQETCDKIGNVVYGPDGRHEDYGYGRINAAAAVE